MPNTNSHNEKTGEPETPHIVKLRVLLRAGTAFLCALIVAATMGVLAYLFYRSQVNSPVLNHIDSTTQNTKKILDLIHNCTTPGEKCYEEGLKRQAETVGNLNQVIILASFCARIPTNTTFQAVHACVLNGLGG